MKTGSQRSNISYNQMIAKDGFDNADTHTENLDAATYYDVKYDLIGKIASGTGLTRKTVAKILYRI